MSAGNRFPTLFRLMMHVYVSLIAFDLKELFIVGDRLQFFTVAELQIFCIGVKILITYIFFITVPSVTYILVFYLIFE